MDEFDSDVWRMVQSLKEDIESFHIYLVVKRFVSQETVQTRVDSNTDFGLLLHSQALATDEAIGEKCGMLSCPHGFVFPKYIDVRIILVPEVI